MVADAPRTEATVTHREATGCHASEGRDLITLNETAQLLEQPVEDVLRAVMCGRLPVVWVGPRPYVDRAALCFGADESPGGGS